MQGKILVTRVAGHNGSSVVEYCTSVLPMFYTVLSHTKELLGWEVYSGILRMSRDIWRCLPGNTNGYT